MCWPLCSRTRNRTRVSLWAHRLEKTRPSSIWETVILVAKSDPITFVENHIGRYAVHVNANDIACMGAVPSWFLMTLLLPEGRSDEAMLNRIWREVEDTCADLGITLCGGHTEITAGLEFPILSGHMLGEVSKESLIRGAGAQIADFILLTSPVPVEGTAILADVKYDFLKNILGCRNTGKREKIPGISRNQRSGACSGGCRNGPGARHARPDRGRPRHRYP